MKRIIFSLLVVFPVIINGQDSFTSSSSRDPQLIHNRSEFIKVGERFIDFLNTVGADQNMSHESEALEICDANCIKIVNGKIQWKGAIKFMPQLIETGKTLGAWVLRPLDIIPAE